MKRMAIMAIAVMMLAGCAVKVPREALQLSPESLATRQMQTRQFDTGDAEAVLVASNAVLQDLGFNLDETSVELGVVVGSKHRDATNGGQVFMLALLGGLGNNPNTVNLADAVQMVKASLVVRGLDREDGDDGEAVGAVSPEMIEQMKGKVYALFHEELKGSFPEDACEKIAESLADSLAEALAGDMDALLNHGDALGVTAVRVTFQRVIFNNLGQINSQEQINDEAVYREFFEKLSKSLFLEANQI
ncbi:MAG: hypothetical protein H0S80_04190 [Desulfovibrionaceae bacterium]|nr:hypothetical protein [Desulfovibrionaceae bacterium]